MAITVEAVYEDGVLKLAQPLRLAEHAKVRLTGRRLPQPSRPNQESKDRGLHLHARRE